MSRASETTSAIGFWLYMAFFAAALVAACFADWQWWRW